MGENRLCVNSDLAGKKKTDNRYLRKALGQRKAKAILHADIHDTSSKEWLRARIGLKLGLDRREGVPEQPRSKFACG